MSPTGRMIVTGVLVSYYSYSNILEVQSRDDISDVLSG